MKFCSVVAKLVVVFEPVKTRSSRIHDVVEACVQGDTYPKPTI
jgi:hypothetical protein